MPGWELVGKEEKDAVNDIFDKGAVFHRYAYPKMRQNIYRVDQFENEIAKKFSVNHALALASGTAALKLALIGLGVKRGDEVITQSFTFVATLEPILELGALPVITEIDKSLNMDPKDLEKKINSKTKVIIPVHMAGVPAKMNEIMNIAKRHNLLVVEDSAQAIGATYDGKFVGTIGKSGIYSLDYAKAINTGDGGVLVTNDNDLFLKARAYADHGHEYNPNFPRGRDTRKTWGFNYKMIELQGAIGLAQLKKLDYVLQKQRENKKTIKDGIKDIKNIEFREIPAEANEAGDTLIFFLENSEKAEKFAQMLAEKGYITKNLPDAIDWHFAGTWYHIFKDFSEYKGKNLEDEWKVSTNLLRRAISLPIFVKMDQQQIDSLVATIHEVAEKV